MQTRNDRFIHLPESYRNTAEKYAERYFRELDHKPFDRRLLDKFAKSMDGLGSVCNLGCCPGHITRYLSENGLDAFGVDLSEEMSRMLGSFRHARSPEKAHQQVIVEILKSPFFFRC